MKLEAHKLEVKIERPPTSELKKWLDVPADKLKDILGKYVDDSMAQLAMVEIEAVAHVTYEKEPEKQ